MGCLDDATIFDLVRGDLDPAAVAAADGHVDSCTLCREVMVATARMVGGDAPALRPGECVGRYVILGELGAGGFGVVYRAFDPSLDRPVALKLVRGGLGPSFTGRLHREAKAMAKLSHPNVVTVFEVGAVGRATFIAMELVEGDSLRDWLARGKPSPLAIRDVFVQAARGLAAAHDAGLTHRDFKPDNVIVGRDGRVRVTDFGLARGGERESASMPEELDELEEAELGVSLTVTGRLVGTPAYMAPEQLEGAAGDALSDQYSFAASLFEALHGERPHGGATLAALREAVLHDDPKRGNGRVPRWLDDAVRRGLRRLPSGRFRSMRELIRALEHDPSGRWRRGFGLLAGVTAAAALAVSLWPRDSALCTGAADAVATTWNDQRAGALAAAFGASGQPFAKTSLRVVDAWLDGWRDAWVGAHRASCEKTRLRGEESEWVLDARMACLERQRRDVDAVVAQLENADEAAVERAVDAVTGLPSPSVCSDEALDRAATPPAELADALAALNVELASARALIAVGSYERASLVVAEMQPRAQALGYDRALAEVLAVGATAKREMGDLVEAEQLIQQSLWAARRSNDARLETDAWLRLGAVQGTRGDYRAAEVSVRNAESMLDRIADGDLAARVESELGVIATHLERFDEAESNLRAALARRVAMFGAASVEVARLHTNLGNLARVRGNLNEAIREHELARAIDAEVLGSEHPNEARHCHNLARIHLLLGNRDEALSLYTKALSLKRRIYGTTHPEVGRTLNSLGLLYLGSHDLVPARAHFLEALAAFAGVRPREQGMTQLNLGRLSLEAGAFDEALGYLEPAVVLLHERLGSSHVQVIEAEEALADALVALGRRDEAVGVLRRARAAAAGAQLPSEVRARIDRQLGLITAEPSRIVLPPSNASPLAVARPTAVPRAPTPPAPTPAPPLPAPTLPAAPTPTPPTSKPPTPPPPQPRPGGAYMPGEAWD